MSLTIHCVVLLVTIRLLLIGSFEYLPRMMVCILYNSGRFVMPNARARVLVPGSKR